MNIETLHLPEPLYIGATAVIPYRDGYAAQLVFTPKYGDSVSLGVRDGNLLHVPLNLVTHCGVKDYRVKYEPYEHNYTVQPRDDDQARVLEEAKALIDQGTNFIAEAPTGWGKSWLGCAIAVYSGQPTLIIVPKSDLVSSWRDNLTKTLKVPPNEIGLIQGAKVDYKNKRFVIALVQSIVTKADNGKFDDDFYKTFGLVLWDEVHRMGAPSFIRSCMLFPARHRVGLSATTYRGDGKMPIVEANIGKVLTKGNAVPMSPKVLVVKTGYSIPKYGRDGRKLIYSAGRLASVYVDMGSSHERNEHIIKFAQAAYNKGREGIVLMSDLIDKHLKILHRALLQAGIPATDIGYYKGGMSPSALALNAKKRIILTTFAMCKEGTDYPHWDTLVLCTPHSDVQQAIGRVMRKKEGKLTPVILDLVDSGSLLQGYTQRRKKSYINVGADVNELN